MDNQVLEWINDLDKADINVRQRARKRLIAHDGDISDTLISLMLEQQGRRSWEAAIILSERHDPRAIEAMKHMLTSRHPVLGQVAAEALCAYGDQYVDVLIDALPASTYMTQIAIVAVLERIGDQRAVEPLLAFLSGQKQGVLLYTTIRALGSLGDAHSADAIRAFIDHEDAHVVKHARLALQRLEASQRH